MPLERAAEVILRVDHGPAPADLHSFQLRQTTTASGRPRVLRVRQVVPDLPGVQIIGARDGCERVTGKQGGDELAEGDVEGGAAAGGVGEEGSAARLEVSPEVLRVLRRERERGPAVDVDQGVVNEVRVAG